MSVAELAPRGGEFERTPPHDLAAEQCVLGGMLMSKDAISDVMEVISPADHYRPAHQLVHDLVSRAVVVAGPDDLEHVGDGVLGHQHPAEDTLLRGEVVRGGPLEFLAAGCYLRDAHLSHLPQLRRIPRLPARAIGSVLSDGSDSLAPALADVQRGCA